MIHEFTALQHALQHVLIKREMNMFDSGHDSSQGVYRVLPSMIVSVML